MYLTKYCCLIGATALLLALSAGCSKRVKICPASGQVMVNGEPAEGAYVVFHAVNNPKRSASSDAARTEKNGAFSAKIHGPGEYAVTVFWPMVTNTEGETIEGDDRLEGKFAKIAQPAARVTITDGQNSIPTIQLTYP
ncbi:MAG TPA: hypothetical protein VFE62_29205 [Gemmataceae bacterium]|nr:hypothetical protein [Gemmataceae bacterium]